MRITNLRRKKMPPLLPKKIKWFVLGLFIGSLCTPAPLPNNPVAIPNVPLFRNVQDNNNSFQARGCPFIPERTLSSLVSFVEGERIVSCESSGNPRAKNPRSSAKGLFQIIDSTARECEEALGRKLDMYNPVDNIACAEYQYEQYGTKPWNASKHCWGY